MYVRAPMRRVLSTQAQKHMSLVNISLHSPQEKKKKTQLLIPQLIETTISGTERTTYCTIYGGLNQLWNHRYFIVSIVESKIDLTPP